MRLSSHTMLNNQLFQNLKLVGFRFNVNIMLHNFKIKLVDYVFIIVLIFTNLGDIQTQKNKKWNEFDGKNDFF